MKAILFSPQEQMMAVVLINKGRSLAHTQSRRRMDGDIRDILLVRYTRLHAGGRAGDKVTGALRVDLIVTKS